MAACASTSRMMTTLALRVADQVARLHGGRLNATTMAGGGERFVLPVV